MTLVWHMYGGNDFKVNEKTSESDGNRGKKNVTINDTNIRQSPTFSNRLIKNAINYLNRLMY